MLLADHDGRPDGAASAAARWLSSQRARFAPLDPLVSGAGELFWARRRRVVRATVEALDLGVAPSGRSLPAAPAGELAGWPYSFWISSISGRNSAMTMKPTAPPIPTIRIGSMIEVSDSTATSTSSS